MTSSDTFEDGGRKGDGRGVHDDNPCLSQLEVLSREECILRLQAQGVGRVSVIWLDSPAIYPVNYIVDEESIVFRTRRGNDLCSATFEAPAAFEIDGSDTLYHEGWSVLVLGRASHVHDAREVARLRAAPLTPWAGTERDCFVKISLGKVSGRHIHHRVPPTTGVVESARS